MHTEGPWSVDGKTIIPKSRNWAQTCVRGNGGTVAICTTTKRNVTDDDVREVEANARLIAAAPDLLAACKELLALWPLSGYELDAFCSATLVPMMHEAVKKAEGK